MLDKVNLKNVLFLDIETVPQFEHYELMPTPYQKLWNTKAKSINRNEKSTPEVVYNRAGIFAEFGKIVCISTGFIYESSIRVKSFCGKNETTLLQQFSEMLNASFNQKDQLLCAHNGKEFDFPYIARRFLINGISLPRILNIAGKKPWEIQHLDTLELWKFGDYKHYTSLSLLTTIFNIPTPKDDIDGSKVKDVYYKEKNLDRIKTYCEKDVVALIQLLRKYKSLNLIENESIHYID